MSYMIMDLGDSSMELLLLQGWFENQDIGVSIVHQGYVDSAYKWLYKIP